MILVLSTADTDLLSIQSVAPAHALAHGQEELPAAFPPVLTANATHLSTIGRLLEELPAAGKSAVVMRLHGGRRACPDSLDLVARTCRERSIPLAVVAADGEHDPDLTAACHLPLPTAGLSDAHTGGASDVTSATGLTISDRISTYFQYGGRRNALHLLRFVADALLGTAFGSEVPAPQPEDGIYHPRLLGDQTSLPAYLDVLSRSAVPPERPRIGVLFYRAHWLSGNLAFIDGLIRAIERAGGEAFPVFCASLRPPARSTPSDEPAQPYLLKRYFLDADDRPRVDALISTLSFAASTISTPVGEGGGLVVDQEERSGVEAATEATGEAGLWFTRLGVPILQALVCSDARAVWNGRTSGLNPLDVAMQVALPEFDGRIITVPVSFKEASPLGFSDPTGGRQESWPGPHPSPLPAGEGTGPHPEGARGVPRYVPDEERCDALARQAVAWGRLRRTPTDQRRVAVVLGSYSGKNGRIGNAVGLDTPASLVRVLEALRNAGYSIDPFPADGDALIHRLIEVGTYDLEFGTWDRRDGALDDGKRGAAPPGLHLGNVFVGIQPPRGWGDDPDAAYHDPELPPPAPYVDFYEWLRQEFGAQAIVHLGKHGTLEWLPGKAVGLSSECAPDALLGELPLIYPFVVNDPGEGTQAKRRVHAVLVGHLPPPLAEAGIHGDLAALERLIVEERTARLLDPTKLPVLRSHILEALRAADLREDVGVSARDISSQSSAVDREFDLLLARIERYLDDLRSATIRDGLHVLGQPPEGEQRDSTLDALLRLTPEDARAPWRSRLSDLLDRTTDEITALLASLDGQFVPAGPSGSPARGMWNVLPTGRNFYSVDPQAIPSPSAWETGRRLADALLARHLGETGRYPTTVGLVVWGTAVMRTHGDDIAQALALLGVRPVWHKDTGRVSGLEPVPTSELGRPRIDVTLHISGFFRDAFPHLVSLLDRAVRLVAELDEPEDTNYIAAHVRQETQTLVSRGVSEETALREASYRLFGSKPGAYGAGLLPLIDHKNWRTAEDLVSAYETWGAFAYGQETAGVSAREAFQSRFASIDVAAKNQDNREHDLFDSDDYFQYHGGMIATARLLRRATGKTAPRAYFGDSSDPRRPAVRSLAEEARRVFRTRVTNPQWLAAMRRHGYKGASELAATVDYLFGYDATAEIVSDWMYERLARTYALDGEQQAFFARSNPWALRDIAERLLEASARGMWEQPPPDVLDELRRVYLETDGDLEGRNEDSPSPLAGEGVGGRGPTTEGVRG